LNAAKERSESALTLCENEKKSSLFAPYSPSPTKMIEASWQRLRQENMIIDPTELIVDLGCGDGRWLISGAKEFQCNALGIEIDAKLVEKAIQNVQEEQMLEKIQVIQGDIMQVDISRAKLVIVYAFAQSLFSIRGHLKSQLSPEAFVLSVGVSTINTLWKALNYRIHIVPYSWMEA
jgi:SAM-dependent methyltransferase